MGSQKAKLSGYGVLSLPKTILAYGEYPWCYLDAIGEMVNLILEVIEKNESDCIVIEEVNIAKARYSQKALDSLHCLLLLRLQGKGHKVYYISSSEWRHILGLTMTAQDKKNNGKLSKLKSKSDLTTVSGRSEFSKEKKKLGVRGKINKKHVAIRYVNETYSMNLKQKDDDVADAICLGLSFFRGALLCDGT